MTGPGGQGPYELTEDAAEALSFQSYAPTPGIDEVWVKRLRKHRAENGWFAEFLRLDAGRVELEGEGGFLLRQLSLSRAEAGRINAFHLHPKRPQNELWSVVEGQLLVCLADCRKHSETSGQVQRIILSAEEPALLHIPAGVAHGYKAGRSGALLLYGMDQQFDAADPNEGRLPWDFFGAELWEEDKG